MRALLEKELREHRLWLLLGVLFVAIYLVGGPPRMDFGPSFEGGIVLGGTVQALAVGVALGYVQLRREARAGTVTALVHRDTGALRPMVAKGIVGVAVLGVVVVLPMLLHRAWASAGEFGLRPTPREIAGPAALALLAWGAGALAATLRGPVVLRLLVAVPGALVLLYGFYFIWFWFSRAWDFIPTSRVALFAAIGVVLFALACRRLLFGEDPDRRPGPIESVATGAICAALLFLPASAAFAQFRFTALHPLPRFFELIPGRMESRTTRAITVEPVGRGAAWTRMDLFADWAAPWLQVYLDPAQGVVRLFELDGARFDDDAPRPGRVIGLREHVLRPPDGRLSESAVVVDGTRIEDPLGGRAWTVRFVESLPRLVDASEVQTAVDEPVPGEASRRIQLAAWVVDPDVLDTRIHVAEEPGGEPLLRWTSRPQTPVTPALLVAAALLEGPLCGAASFASAADPQEALVDLWRNPLHVGRRRAGLLALEVLLAAACAWLASRRLRRLGAGRGRIVAWALAILLFGPVLAVAMVLLESRPSLSAVRRSADLALGSAGP